jgi:hypothetical protein
MLWYKAWLETRWRFWIGLALLIASAAVGVFSYPTMVKALAQNPDLESSVGGVLGEEVRFAFTVIREYRGYIWWQWFRQNFRDAWVILAIVLGTGGLLSQTGGGGALYTLSLPASRRRLVCVRAATGLAELLVMAIVPALLVSLLSPAIGESYSALDAVVHGVCLFIGGTIFFSLAFLFSTVFTDVWRPALIAIAVFYCVTFVEQFARAFSGGGLTWVMSAESYFRAGEVPLLGLMAAAAVSAALLYGAIVNIERRDF